MKEYASTFQFDGDLLQVMLWHKGKSNGINRWDLVVEMYGPEAVTDETRNDKNPFDRAVRNGIERLRADGHHICNRGNADGYYYADSLEEYEEFKRYYLGPAYNKFVSVGAMDRKAEERWGRQPKPVPAGQGQLFSVGG